MATATVNGVRIHYELRGSGEEDPLVLVHGAWWSHRGWEAVVPRLARSRPVVAYDRRGHSASERPPGPKTMRDDVEDLAALIEHLDLAPAWIAGVSSGGTVAMKLAAARPDLVRGLLLHEPALFRLVADDPVAGPAFAALRTHVEGVVRTIDAGEHERAAREFVGAVMGPDRWAELAPEYRRILIGNASTFADEFRDPEALWMDLDTLAGFDGPALLTLGDQSAPLFGAVAERVASALDGIEVVTLPGAGHVPQRTHPDAYVETVEGFMARHECAVARAAAAGAPAAP